MAEGAWERGVGKSLRTRRTTSEQQQAAHAMDCRFECVPRATRVGRYPSDSPTEPFPKQLQRDYRKSAWFN